MGGLANGLGTCFTIRRFSPPSQGGEVPDAALAYLGTYKCCSKRAAVFTFLLRHADGKLSRYSPDPQSTRTVMELPPAPVDTEF